MKNFKELFGKKMAILLLVILPIMLLAQWSSDAANNTVVSDLSGDNAVPKIAGATNGDTYVGWMSTATGNYDVYLQRYNLAGEMQWEQNGIVVSDNTQDSWITDWDMQTDNAGNAILAFNDIRSGNWDIYAYKISPDGEQLWGEDGIQLSSATGMDVAPKIAATSNNDVIVTWSASDDDGNGEVKIQRISAEGTILWENDYVISGENAFSWPQLLTTDDEGVIVKYFEDSGPYWAPNRHVFAKKLDADGIDVWEEDALVSDAGGISAWTQIFDIISDNNNGVYIAWHEDRDGDQNSNIFYQHILADGSSQFDDGNEIVNDYNNEHYYPEIAVDIADNIYVSWTKMDADQNNRGISAQMLDNAGTRMWGETGTTVLALGTSDPISSFATIIENQFVAGYFGTSNVSTYRLDYDGNFVWDDEIVLISTNPDNPSDLAGVKTSAAQIVTAWGGDSGIYAQNINADGTLGETSVILEAPTNLQVDAATGLVTWDVPPSMTPDSYNIYLDDTMIDNVENDVFEYMLENMINGTTYSVDISAVYGEENSEMATVEFIYEGTDAETNLTLELGLSNYPNPFNPTTTISFNLTENSHVELVIYNSRGQKTQTLNSSELAAGEHKMVWNGKDNQNISVASGIYFYRLKTANIDQTNKMILLK